MAGSIFDVFIEDIKGPHVAWTDARTPMEKHKGKEAKKVLAVKLIVQKISISNL